MIDFSHVHEVLSTRDWIVNHQAVQDDYNHIILKIVVKKKPSGFELRKIMSLLRGVMGTACVIDIEFLDDIPIEKSGKFLSMKRTFRTD